MKLVVISNLYPPYVRGGAEIFAHRMVHSLQDMGHEAIVITSAPYQRGALSFKKSVHDGVPVYSFYPFNVYHYLNGSRYGVLLRILWHFLDIFNIHSAGIIRLILAKEKPDAVITHNLMGIGFLIPRIIKKLRIPHIHILHDVQLATPSGIILHEHENAFEHTLATYAGYTWLMRFLTRNISIVVSPTKYLLDFYRARGFFKQAESYVLPLPGPNTAEIHTPEVPTHQLRLLYVGQLTSAKGPQILLEAVQYLGAISFTLRLVGEGPLLQALQLQYQHDSRIIFEGKKDAQTLERVYRESDLVVVPTLCYENSPMVILEAQQYGVPVIASRIGGIPELIDDTVTGFLVDPGNSVKLAARIREANANRDMLKKVSNKALILARERTVGRYNAELLTYLRM